MKHTFLFLVYVLPLLMIVSCRNYPPAPDPYQEGGNIITTGTEPAVSPDGTKIVFLRSGVVFICDTSGNNVTQLTTTGMRCENPKWAPDGQRIGYIQVDTIKWDRNRLTIIDIASRAITYTPNADSLDYYPHEGWNWSPDNQQIAFITYPNHVPTIRVIRDDGSGFILSSFIASEFAWSPNSSQLACIVKSYSDTNTVCVATIGQGTLSKLFSKNHVKSIGWLPDGNRISYYSGFGALATYDIKARLEKEIILGYIQYQVSPDGKYIGYTRSFWDGNPDGSTFYYIVVYDLAKDSSSTLVNSNGGLTFTWAPSSKQIIYSYNGSIYKTKTF